MGPLFIKNTEKYPPGAVCGSALWLRAVTLARRLCLSGNCTLGGRFPLAPERQRQTKDGTIVEVLSPRAPALALGDLANDVESKSGAFDVNGVVRAEKSLEEMISLLEGYA